MVGWILAELITKRQCHERQHQVSYQDCNVSSPNAGTGKDGERGTIRGGEVQAQDF
jgi:hypothetical protein